MADTSVSYQCPNCGGPLGYKPGSGDSVKCEYCESEFTSDARKLVKTLKFGEGSCLYE